MRVEGGEQFKQIALFTKLAVWELGSDGCAALDLYLHAHCPDAYAYYLEVRLISVSIQPMVYLQAKMILNGQNQLGGVQSN